jgi:holo-[acyl-carrier protein] synthase
VIHGIGIDMVYIPRMQANIDRFGDRFASKILSRSEFREYEDTGDQARFLAKHFAAKEAAVKALGTGFITGMTLRNISIVHNQHGQPRILCEGRACEIFASYGIQSGHLAISDEMNYACASVVLEKRARNP